MSDRISRLAAERLDILRALTACTEVLKSEALAEVRAGARKTDVAKLAGVSRVTLDAWLRQ